MTWARLEYVADPGLYVRNTVAMWASLAPWTQASEGTPDWSVIGIPAQDTVRVILQRPLRAGVAGPVTAMLAGQREYGRMVVEDSFGGPLLPAADGVTVDRMPVMVRPAGQALPAASGIRTARVTSPGLLGEADRVIVDGFPRRSLQPYRPGRSLPALALRVPGWRVWLAWDGGTPAAACCSYDDGTSLGIYWLATLPRSRSRGLGRAVLTAALAAAPARPAVLTATAAGQPLYTSLGFRAVSTAAWYRAPGRAGRHTP